jgi:hypothetical protein
LNAKIDFDNGGLSGIDGTAWQPIGDGIESAFASWPGDK